MTGNDSKIEEPDVNKLIGRFLCSRLIDWAIVAEKRDVIEEEPTWQPDIVFFNMKRNSAVVIECEFEPAYNVTKEATRHLGKSLKNHRASIDSVIALVLPESFKQPEKLCIETAEYEFEVFDKGPNSEGVKYSGDLSCLASVICQL